MRHAISVLSTLVMLLVLGGCGGSPFPGDWTVDKDAMREQMVASFDRDNPGMPQSTRDLAVKTATDTLNQMNTALQIKKDGTFTITTSMQSQKQTVIGIWATEGDTIILTPTTGGGQRSVGRISKGKLLIANPSGQGPKETVLRRS